MLQQARRKVPDATFVLGDARDPVLESGSYDVVMSRQVLWTLPDPQHVFARWVDLLKPGGLVVRVDAVGTPGLGWPPVEAEPIVRHCRSEVTIRHLTESVFWGKVIHDERYLLTSPR